MKRLSLINDCINIIITDVATYNYSWEETEGMAAFKMRQILFALFGIAIGVLMVYTLVVKQGYQNLEKGK